MHGWAGPLCCRPSTGGGGNGFRVAAKPEDVAAACEGATEAASNRCLKKACPVLRANAAFSQLHEKPAAPCLPKN
ncbi:hypothetical protein EN935_06790 [Mesorhizobium sp. M7D.F.Ca.US.004.03.1.1]|nr:hypothetical protein EN993_15155 [Mesorhizobium sp. M7D.F.Ca.US.004.01.2.1]RVA34356.1 hypothetical protein EN935_06790 [Mesorhizobium sp. M7D.F.Ca.US.004.03.1.1]